MNYRFYHVSAILLIITCSFNQLSAMNARVIDMMARMAREAQENMERIAREQAARRQREAERIDNLRAERRRLRERGAGENDRRMQEIQEQLAQVEHDKQRDEKWEDLGRDVVGNAARFGFDQFGQELNANREKEAHERKKEEIKVQEFAKGIANHDAAVDTARVAQEGQNQRLQMIFDNKWKIVGVIAATIGAYYGTKLAYEYIQATMGKPTLVRETSRTGIPETIANFFSYLLYGQTAAPVNLTDIVLAPNIEQGLHALADDAKQTKELGLPYQNLLFYGPPGTGKTEFARLLARYSGMDYAILSGADFSQFKKGEGITELHKLFEWAESSPKGLLIFIDEADACFRDRGTLDKDRIDVVNAFLSHTGGNSDKFLVVMATNYENELDAAVRSRMHRKIPFMLPALPERIRILKKKMEKYLFNDVRTFEQHGETVQASLIVDPSINDAYLAEIAKNIEGFSGRDIDQAIAEVRLRTYRTELADKEVRQYVVTKDIFEKVLKDKAVEVEKDRKTNEMQYHRAQKAQMTAVAA